jgi:peptidoglycan/xylan/chitin deacetylase (PgdA/CDA1 family)
MKYRVIQWLAVLAVCGAVSPAVAGDCPGNPDALGTSRTLVVDPAEHPLVGAMNYRETLPLEDKEVVITLDDGPIAPYTGKILDILASQCVRATYFLVGEMARARPELVRRAYREGHTIGTHSMTHPYAFKALSIEKAKAQIDGGIDAASEALGEPNALSPFFRFPGFGRGDATEAYAASRGLMVWSADVPADDWLHIGDKEITRRAIARLERKGKGILLLHDIHAKTVAALPALLKELKTRGFRIVHVVAASKDQPKTNTEPQAWIVPDRNTLADRRKVALPAVQLADVQGLNGDFLAQHPSDDLCSLKAMARKLPVANRRVAAMQIRHHSQTASRHRTARGERWFMEWAN